MQYLGFHLLGFWFLFIRFTLTTRQKEKARSEKNIQCFFQPELPHRSILLRYICYLIIYYFFRNLKRLYYISLCFQSLRNLFFVYPQTSYISQAGNRYGVSVPEPPVRSSQGSPRKERPAPCR